MMTLEESDRIARLVEFKGRMEAAQILRKEFNAMLAKAVKRLREKEAKPLKKAV